MPRPSHIPIVLVPRRLHSVAPPCFVFAFASGGGPRCCCFVAFVAFVAFAVCVWNHVLLLSSCVQPDWALTALYSLSPPLCLPSPVATRHSSAKPCGALPSEWGSPISFSLSAPCEKSKNQKKNKSKTRGRSEKSTRNAPEEEQRPAQCLWGARPPPPLPHPVPLPPHLPRPVAFVAIVVIVA